MKKIIYLLVFLLMIGMVNAYICQDETDVRHIPCDVVSPIIDCEYYTYNITSSANGGLIEDGNLTAVGDGTYKFSFDQTYGTYNIFLCENSTIYGSITVGDFETDYEFAIYLFVLIAWVILIFGFYKEDYNIICFAGIVMLVIGTYITINGLDTFNDYLSNAFGFIHIGIGAYVMIRGGYEIYKTGF